MIMNTKQVIIIIILLVLTPSLWRLTLRALAGLLLLLARRPPFPLLP